MGLEQYGPAFLCFHRSKTTPAGPGSGNLNVGKSGVLGSTAVPYTAARLRSQGRSDAAIRPERAAFDKLLG